MRSRFRCLPLRWISTTTIIYYSLLLIVLIAADDGGDTSASTSTTTSTTQTSNGPAFKIHLNKKGLQFINRIASRLVTDVLKDESGQTIEAQNDGATLKLANVKIVKYDENMHQDVQFSPGIGVEYTCRVPSAVMTTDYEVTEGQGSGQQQRRAKSSSSSGGGGDGSLAITMTDVSVDLLISMLSSEGRFKPSLEDCVCVIRSAQVKVTKGSADDLKKHFKDDLITGKAKSFLQQLICKFAKTTFVPRIEKMFSNYQVIDQIFGHVYYNYSLTEDPTVNADGIVTSYAGNAFIKHISDGSIETGVPFAAPSIPDGPCPPDRMMCLVMTNYTLRSLLYWMGKEHRFDYNFTAKRIPSFAGHLRTECSKDDLCAGSAIPALSEKYPNSSLEIFIRETPGTERVMIKKGVINSTGEGIVNGYVRRPNGDREWLFSCNQESYTTMKKPVFKASNYSVDITLDANHFNLYNVSTTMPDDINAETLSLLTGYSMDNYVTPDLTKTLGRCLKLPKLIEFNMVNGYAQFEEDVVVIASDFCDTSEQCVAAAKEAGAEKEKGKTDKPDYGNFYDDH